MYYIPDSSNLKTSLINVDSQLQALSTEQLINILVYLGTLYTH